MRTLLFVVLLALPSLAFANDPCSHGWNGPINADTNPDSEQQTTTSSEGQSHTSFGSHTAQRTAYPH